ncbi:MAG TPA: alpha/beta hydrolase-fold protein [Opitutaceae bacterium]|nr:alpha/beta hydrolase-fold protein [Opitutaceae bacterium]
MKSIPLPLLLAASLALGCLTSTRAAPASPYPPVTLPDTEVRSLPTSAHGRNYVLEIGLPGSYRSDPARRYPVLYVTDGYWDFPTLYSSYLNLVYDKVAPEAIIVGIGYPGDHTVDEYNQMRLWELSPTRLGGPADHNSGHAAEFLNTIEHEIIPFVEHEYRVDPSYRVLAGSSMGGLFTLYALFTRPSLFNGYIAASPAVTAGADWLFGYEARFERHPQPINARLFMTGAEYEHLLPGIRRFDARLEQAHFAGLVYQFRMIDHANHAGEKGESYMRGMQFVFAPLVHAQPGP